MIHKNTYTDKLIGLTLCGVSVLIVVLAAIGAYHLCCVPGRSEKITVLEQQVDVWKHRSAELEKYIEKQRTAFRYENLFMLAADSNDLLDFSELEEYLCEKRGLCKAVE